MKIFEFYLSRILSVLTILLCLSLFVDPAYSQQWEHSFVDTLESTVGNTKVNIDNANNPHILYYDEDAEIIKHAYRNNTSWSIETIKAGTAKANGALNEYLSSIIEINLITA